MKITKTIIEYYINKEEYDYLIDLYKTLKSF